MKDTNLDVVAPRCAKCNEPVSMNKRDCLCTRAVKKGQLLARVIFDKRSKGKSYRNSEAHVGEAELASMLAAVYELGAEDKYRTKPSSEVLEALKELVRVAVIDSGKGRDAEGYRAFERAREIITKYEGSSQS